MATLKGTLTPAHTVRGEMSVGGVVGTTNYEDLENKPQINGVELVGNKSLDDLGIINSSIIANPYDSTSTYAVGAYVTHENNLHKCNTAISTAEEWNAEHWTLVDVISAIPTKTSELDNDSGFITGDNYYDKSEIDTALGGKADKSDTYTKSQVDTALSAKANASDTYTKAQTDSAIVGLIDDTTTANNKAWSSSKITDEIINILPTGTASGSVASFNTSLALPLVSCSVDNTATKVYQFKTNIFDGQSESGTYDQTTGARTSSATLKRCVNPIRVKPNTSYYFVRGNGAGRYFYYDIDNNFITSEYKQDTGAITTPANCYYMTFALAIALWSGNIGVNLPATNTNYEDYVSPDVFNVSEIDNIVAYVGTNNIFADIGDIDITYKKSIDDAIAELQSLILS